MTEESEVNDAVIPILRGIQTEISAMRGDFATGLSGLNQRMDGLTQRVDGLTQRVDGLTDVTIRLERHATTTNELLGLMHERLLFIERSASVAADSRSSLDARVSRLEARMDAVEREPPTD